MHADSVQPAVEHGKRVLDDLVDVGGLRLGDGKAREGGELVDQAAHGFDRAGNGFRAGAHDGERGGIGGRGAVQMALNALRRKCDGRQRILDFMRDPARDFPPCRLLLRLQQVREIFEHDDVSGAFALMAQRGDGDGDVQRDAGQLHFHLAGGHAHAVGAAKQGLEIFQHFGGENIGQGCSAKNLRRAVVSALGMKHAEQRLIDVGHAARRHRARARRSECFRGWFPSGGGAGRVRRWPRSGRGWRLRSGGGCLRGLRPCG